MTKPNAKAKPKKPAKPKAEPKPLLGETAVCGALFSLSLSPRPETPHKHACTCSAFYSSDPVCHVCSCSACDTARAEYSRLMPKLTDFELLKRKLNDFGCKCNFEGEHDGVRCEELDHDPCLVCLVNRVEISPGVTASGSLVTQQNHEGAAMTEESTPQDAEARERDWNRYVFTKHAILKDTERDTFAFAWEAGFRSRDAELERVTRELAELRSQANERRATMNATRACEGCGKQSRIFTAGCDHCDYEDK